MYQAILDRIESELLFLADDINESHRMGQADLRARQLLERALATMATTKPEPQMSITGAANLAGTIKDRINAAKAKVAEVTANTDGALAKLNEAADRGDKIAKQIEAEADDLNSQLGQFTNE